MVHFIDFHRSSSFIPWLKSSFHVRVRGDPVRGLLNSQFQGLNNLAVDMKSICTPLLKLAPRTRAALVWIFNTVKELKRLPNLLPFLAVYTFDPWYIDFIADPTLISLFCPKLTLLHLADPASFSPRGGPDSDGFTSENGRISAQRNISKRYPTSLFTDYF
ncbi:hypothetical protein Scep_001833 [Stephania cephalantha]|uniref:Uncharacterized protein n=1 Tax=Stephania cephalantha TaxID=152367 RepID=A0AAP0Q3R2_9MAGN